MEFKFSKNFKIKIVEKIIDEIISEIKSKGSLEDYDIVIKNINIAVGDGCSTDIRCMINLSENNPHPTVIHFDFKIYNDLVDTIPIKEVEGICDYNGFSCKDYTGRIKVFLHKNEDYLKLTLKWLNINKTVTKTYKVQENEFVEVLNYSDSENSIEKGSSYTMDKKEDN